LAEIRLTADVLAFGQIDGQTHVLLVQRDQDPYKGTWSLPGAFVWEVETSQEAAYRALRVKTGLQAVELQQYGLFDTVDRDPRTRVASTTYLGELAPSEVHLVKYHHQETVKLFPVDQLPDMAFDHADIIRAAHRQGRLYPQATAA
jgi:8-oxo-dGTP diphosphatase